MQVTNLACVVIEGIVGRVPRGHNTVGVLPTEGAALLLTRNILDGSIRDHWAWESNIDRVVTGVLDSCTGENLHNYAHAVLP